ncbi:MAG TPA: hypothetical protein VK828_06495 [Terriglobales bacterium]|jgi:hypothetical protein|nr:hypothetical protein [Terriglobales bacterium]
MSSAKNIPKQWLKARFIAAVAMTVTYSVFAFSQTLGGLPQLP